MEFTVKKAANCFAEAQTYEYRLPVTGERLARLLPGEFAVRENHKFRRPVFSAVRPDGLEVKGILAGQVVKVNYHRQGWEAEKAAFEGWLTHQPE